MHGRDRPNGSETMEKRIVMTVTLRHRHNTLRPFQTASALLVSLGIIILLLPKAGYAQEGDSLPDWSGVWAMNGGTVFDRATVEGRGGSNTPGVR
ncbi:MAG TPA: hypothetical protein DCS89_01105, partial [Gammaproteobacteria bacterium]|nr:hypothetical protein [Gammaproteobacteria bacterium]